MKFVSEKNAIKGYKVFNNDWTCRHKMYELGKSYHEDNVSICEQGMHFCKKLEDCFNYYYYAGNFSCNDTIKIAEVIGFGKVDEQPAVDSKIAVSDLKIIKELTFPESGKLVVALDKHYHISARIKAGVITNTGMLYSVRGNGYNIVYFNNPSEELQLAAVKQNLKAIKYIKNPTLKVKEYVKDYLSIIY